MFGAKNVKVIVQSRLQKLWLRKLYQRKYLQKSVSKKVSSDKKPPAKPTVNFVRQMHPLNIERHP